LGFVFGVRRGLTHPCGRDVFVRGDSDFHVSGMKSQREMNLMFLSHGSSQLGPNRADLIIVTSLIMSDDGLAAKDTKARLNELSLGFSGFDDEMQLETRVYPCIHAGTCGPSMPTLISSPTLSFPSSPLATLQHVTRTLNFGQKRKEKEESRVNKLKGEQTRLDKTLKSEIKRRVEMNKTLEKVYFPEGCLSTFCK
jgi:hypothetical protein